MLFKKFKGKMICFFEVMIIVWYRKVLILRKLELKINKLKQYLINTTNNIKNYFNTPALNTLYLEEFY